MDSKALNAGSLVSTDVVIQGTCESEPARGNGPSLDMDNVRLLATPRPGPPALLQCVAAKTSSNLFCKIGLPVAAR